MTIVRLPIDLQQQAMGRLLFAQLLLTAKTYFLDINKIRLKPSLGFQPFLIPLFLPQNLSSMNKDTHFIGQPTQAGSVMTKTPADYRLYNYHAVLQPLLQWGRHPKTRKNKGRHQGTCQYPCQRRRSVRHPLHLGCHQRQLYAASVELCQETYSADPTGVRRTSAICSSPVCVPRACALGRMSEFISNKEQEKSMSVNS